LIVVDTSAVVAILANEIEGKGFTRFLVQSRATVIGAPTYFELLMVACGQRKIATEAEVARLLSVTGVSVVPWTPEHVALAQAAFLKFGKGRHPAKLNYGDCMSYALAKSLGCPLLYKGEDFAKTDLTAAL
jgi:ribonuclease VapC